VAHRAGHGQRPFNGVPPKSASIRLKIKPGLMDMDRAELLGKNIDELVELLGELGFQSFRARQLWHWLYVRRTTEWKRMRNLPGNLRAQLAERYLLRPVQIQESLGLERGTRKVLVALPDGACVEMVLLPVADRLPVCLSSQVGCRFRCAFCASGQLGWSRNLSAGEIVGQVLLAADLFGERPSHVLFMGVGEPLDNYENVLKAIRILNHADGLAIGARRITISTCGLVTGIRRLADEGLQIELSVSLHAPNDAIRSKLMPVHRRHSLDELLEACKEYTDRTRRIITFEYTLIRDLNDRPEHARELVCRLNAFPCRVNLIPLSAVPEFDGAPSPAASIQVFQQILDQAGINTTLRDSRGSDFQAACGQLRCRLAMAGAPQGRRESPSSSLSKGASGGRRG